MSKFLKTISILMVTAAAIQLTGCAQMSLSPPKSSIENIQKGRQINNASAAIGTFTEEKHIEQQISLRGVPLGSPINDSFAQYLQETLRVELQASGLTNASSPNIITGTLTKSEANAPIGTGKGVLAARFIVTQNNTIRYDKELNVNATWDSSLAAVIAIPLAAGQYELLYRKLVGILLDDPDFQQAIKKE